MAKEIQPYMDMPEAQELYKKIEYSLGSFAMRDRAFLDAIDEFEKANDYSDASVKLDEAKTKYFDGLITEKNYSEASAFYHKKMEPYSQFNEKLMLQPGDSGEIPAYIFNVIRIMELGRNIPKNEDTYRDEYIPAVQKLEEHFGLEADGNITLDEYIAVNDLIYKSAKSDKVKKLVEKLYDLSYLRSLAEDHTVYVDGYYNGIKNAEKDLGLMVDGVVTSEEYEIILEQKVVISKPENFTAQVKNDVVTLTWSKVPGVVEYKVYIYDDNISAPRLLGSTKECRWIDKGVVTNVRAKYTVEAHKYTEMSSTDIIRNIPPYYARVTISELQKNFYDHAGKLVEMVNVPFGEWQIEINSRSSKAFSDLLKAKTQDSVLIIYGYNNVGNLQKYVCFKINNPQKWASTVINNLFNALGNNQVKKVTVKGKVNPDSHPVLPEVFIESISWD